MNLSVIERIILLGILPKEGSFANLRLLRSVKEDLSFDENENKLLKFRQNEGNTMWDDVKMVDGKPIPMVPERKFAIGSVVTGLIVSALNDLNKQQKLTEQHFSLYEKFIDSIE